MQGWLFPQVLRISKEWIASCLTCKSGTFPQLLLLVEFAHDAADRIYRAIVAGAETSRTLRPILRPYDTVGSTRWVDFDTTKAVFATRPDRCHLSHVVADTGSWEQKMASVLEDMDEVEVSGEARKDKAAKVATTRTLWVPAVNNHGGFGYWAFVEVSDPWNAEGLVRSAIGRTHGN